MTALAAVDIGLGIWLMANLVITAGKDQPRGAQLMVAMCAIALTLSGLAIGYGGRS